MNSYHGHSSLLANTSQVTHASPSLTAGKNHPKPQSSPYGNGKSVTSWLFPKQQCLICRFHNHIADVCCHKYQLGRVSNHGQPPLLPTCPPSVNYLAYSPQATWYLESAATNHIILDISNLSIFADYKGSNRVLMVTAMPLTLRMLVLPLYSLILVPLNSLMFYILI